MVVDNSTHRIFVKHLSSSSFTLQCVVAMHPEAHGAFPRPIFGYVIMSYLEGVGSGSLRTLVVHLSYFDNSKSQNMTAMKVWFTE